MSILAAVLLLVAAPAATTAEEEALIAGTIAALRPQIPAPDAVAFRRVHLRSSGAALSLCGEVWIEAPHRAPAWLPFVALRAGGMTGAFIGDESFVDAGFACRPSNGRWDYERDFAERFTAELRRD